MPRKSEVLGLPVKAPTMTTSQCKIKWDILANTYFLYIYIKIFLSRCCKCKSNLLIPLPFYPYKGIFKFINTPKTPCISSDMQLTQTKHRKPLRVHITAIARLGYQTKNSIHLKHQEEFRSGEHNYSSWSLSRLPGLLLLKKAEWDHQWAQVIRICL